MNPMFIKILRWMMQEKVWRFMGFASAIIGLLCYALSSSFNHLFGHWNLFKIIIYTVFSFIICFLILYSKTWDPSSSVRFKAQLAFLVLTITSVYSFFSDKVVNGKPDAYSLMSCVAFAIMSLSLSRQTQCGFQVDLLYFFLGCLIVQLMKIKLLLGIVGVGFSYSLIILRSCFPSMDAGLENDCPPVGLEDENSVVLVVDSPNITVSSMMEQLRTYVKALQHDNSKLIEHFEDKSDSLLSDRSFEGTVMIDSLQPVMIQKLQDTAKLMMSVGFEKECSEVYISCRRECLQLQEVSSLSSTIEEVHKMTWEDLNNQVKRWIKASKVSLKILFPIERRLSDLVFLGFSTAANLAFTEVCKGCTLQLLNFADGVATGSRSSERLFGTLKMFETLRDLIPEFESLFCDPNSVSLRNEAVTVLKRLGEAIRGLFKELENSIRQHPAMREVPAGGNLHPLARFVMNYLIVAFDHLQTLEQVFQDFVHPLTEFEDRVQSSSPVSLQMNRIIEVLENNLVTKSKIYKDPALCYVFLMNNSMHIAHRIKDTKLGVVLGNDVIQKQKEKVQQHHEHYKKCSWGKVLEILKLDIIESMPPNEVAESMKEKLQSFNMVFEEICRVQSSWVIYNEQLSEEIRISIEKILLPAYGNFIALFQSVPELSKDTDEYIKYGKEDIEARLNDLFRERIRSAGSRR